MDILTKVPTIYGNWNELFGATWAGQIEKLKAKFGVAIQEVKMPGVDLVEVPVVYIAKDSVIALLKFLKTEAGFEYGFLSDLTATDEQPEELRFEVVYNLFSHVTKARVRVKLRLREGEDAPTAVSLWSAANWAEREVFDMFGVRFQGHPDLRRVLMDERFQGHPLRKDYPLRGYQIFTTPEPVHPELLED